MLALGFAGAFRRSELVALLVADLAPDGFRVTIRRSKRIKKGRGRSSPFPAVASCDRSNACRPAGRVQHHRRAAVSRSRQGRLHRQHGTAGGMKAAVVKVRARTVELDVATLNGHSLRSGFLTRGAEHGASVFKLMEVSRHKSVDVLSGYVRRSDLFRDHARAAFL